MRTIKFRAWNRGSAQMKEWDDIKTMSDLWCVISGMYDGYKPMQFTGLLDKNGKEIYEGDIIKPTRSPVGDVYYNKGRFWLRNFYRPEFDNPSDVFGEAKSDELEVIGNIYENPGLLHNHA